LHRKIKFNRIAARTGSDSMKSFRPRDLRHTLPALFMCLLPLLTFVGCSSGVSGHAPGLAGQQALDPGTFTYPLAYIKRPFPTKDINAADLITSTTGGDVYVREQASAGGAETNITKSITLGMGDVRDLDVSADGKLLIFSLRLPLNPNKDNTDVTQPTWKIYQYDAGTKIVTQLTTDATTAGHDIGAHYLPDGRIVFASTRQAGTQALLVDEGDQQFPAQSASPPKQPIFLLHVMNADGTNIHQISFNTNHDFAPSVLANGQIVFSRYDAANGGHISLYRANPDGTKLELYYGANSHATGASSTGAAIAPIEFLNARQRADGKLVVIGRPFMGTQLGGDILQIDADNYVECNQAATPSTSNGTCATARPGQSSATSLGVTIDAGQPSLQGRFASVYPLYDGTNRMVVSWSPCFVLDKTVTPAATRVCTNDNTSGVNVTLAPPAYTIWIYDLSKGTLSPVLASDPLLTIVDPVVLQARTPIPAFSPDAVPTGPAGILASNTNAPLGVLEIRSVYDFDGVDVVPTQTNPVIASIAALADPTVATADQRPARFIRIEKAVEIPADKVRKINTSAFGPTDMGMRDILAYAPIEPDGSVKIQLPADVPFTIEILDKNARRISAAHTTWMQLRPGETKTCNGCHTQGSTSDPSHGRAGLTTSVNAGAPAGGSLFPHTATFPAAAMGDTMADARVSDTCQNGTEVGCSEIPSIDVHYTDVWTDPGSATQAAPFAYLYADLTTPQPINSHCQPLDPLCRSTIEYPLQIQPIWDFVRQTVVGGVVTADHTCTLCHNKVDAASAVRVPAANLDLTSLASTVDITVNTSYEQLLFAHNEQELNMGVLQDVSVVVPGPPDANGAPTAVNVPVSLAPPLAAGSANGSNAKFFSLFNGTYQGGSDGTTPYVDHTSFLTAAELRLISEWLDIGAQYYNNPFVAPAAN
jgi:hypothetical protein